MADVISLAIIRIGLYMPPALHFDLRQSKGVYSARRQKEIGLLGIMFEIVARRGVSLLLGSLLGC